MRRLISSFKTFLQASARCCVLACLSLPAFADVRIILDVSRSMAENDPQNFRGESIQLLIDSIPNGDKAGVWTFGQFVNLLVPHEPVDADWRRDAANQLDQLGAPANRTNMGRALQEASYDFLFSTYKGPVDVVLITDGRVDIAPNESVNRVERERILNQLIPSYAAANARIHTIAISENADHALLKQMSDRTGGQYQKVTNPQNLAKIMGSLSSEVSPANLLKLQQQSFDVDQSIRELTVLMYHNQGAVSLVAPNGDESSAVKPFDQRWRVGSGFSQVSISSPMQGRWQVKGQLEPNTRIRVISNVNLNWSSPETSAVAKGNLVAVEAEVVDGEGKPIARDLAAIISATLRVDGALIPVQIQRDKIVARIVPSDDATSLNMELNIDGGTFNRLITRQIRFVDPYISEVLLTEQGYEWRLYPNRLLSNVESIDAMVEYDMDEEMQGADFTQTNAGYWVWILPLDQARGVYEIKLKGQMEVDDDIVMLPAETISLQIPPSANSGLAMTPDLATTETSMMLPESEVSSGEFIKDPIIEFEELKADIVVSDPQTPSTDWTDATEAQDAPVDNSGGSSLNIMTYLLLSIPGILVLVLAYLFYRRLEQKAKVSTSEEELILGGDEFAGLDDLDGFEPDSDLDISSLDGFDDDDSLAEAPTIDEIIDEDLPTPEQTEAPSPAVEDMLDSASLVQDTQVDDTEVDPEEELFDISSIDDDLADLDLALDGDDPFADDEDDPKG